MLKLILKLNNMKTLKLIAGIAFLSVAVWSCKNEAEPETKIVEIDATEVKSEIAIDAKMAKAEFNIEGMTCAIGCAKTIEKKLASMEGVKSAKVDFDNKIAMVEYDEATVTATSLEKTVTDAGDTYSVNGMKTVESFTTNFAKKDGKEMKKGHCSGGKKGDCKGKEGCKKENCEHKA